MQWVFVKLLAFGNFDYFSQIHDCYPIADVTHNGQIMRYEEIGQAKTFLKLF
jgi:hypothetical protein